MAYLSVTRTAVAAAGVPPSSLPVPPEIDLSTSPSIPASIPAAAIASSSARQWSRRAFFSGENLVRTPRSLAAEGTASVSARRRGQRGDFFFFFLVDRGVKVC